MNWGANRRAVDLAASRLERVRRVHGVKTRWLRDALHEHRGLFAIAGGFGAGLLLGRLPARSWLRSALSAIGTAVAIARTPIGPVAIGAFMARRAASSEGGEAAPPR
ncbi:MAG: hypothetical protein J0L88_06680 [Xanthomonadales bacterium]|nr:hypothetical protein [Xanthomonadales bacterium]